MDNSGVKNTATYLAVDGDRFKELKAFDDTKAGVKGLLDAGITSLPKIFIRPPEELFEDLKLGSSQVEFPAIDLSGILGDDQNKSTVIDEIRRASEEWGFFRLINHGIPANLLDGMIDGTCKFHELDAELKEKYCSRDLYRIVRYSSNIDLFQSNVANWRDTLTVNLMTSDQVEPDELPEVCRNRVIDYISQATKLGETLFELLSEDHITIQHAQCQKKLSELKSTQILRSLPFFYKTKSVASKSCMITSGKSGNLQRVQSWRVHKKLLLKSN